MAVRKLGFTSTSVSCRGGRDAYMPLLSHSCQVERITGVLHSPCQK
jgi:hypothetical protein